MTEDPTDSIDWPKRPTVASLGAAIGDTRGLDVVVQEVPTQMRHPQISGLTVVSGSRADIFYDTALSPLNRVQTILHEFAHILHGDVDPSTGASHAPRTTFDDSVEQRAEATGLHLLDVLHGAQGRSEVFDFLTGAYGAESNE